VSAGRDTELSVVLVTFFFFFQPWSAHLPDVWW
jgi:hypothetical protein